MKLGWVILYVPDVAAALDFYERAFGLARRFVHESGTYAEMETGATALAFAAEPLAVDHGITLRVSRPGENPAAVEIALTTDDVDAAWSRATEAGASAVKPPEKKPWGQTVAWVRDLNGALVELCTPMG